MNNKGGLNMRIKKIIGVIFVVLIMLILVACGGKTDNKEVPVYQGMVVSKDLDTGRTRMSFSLMIATNDEKEDIDQDDPYDNFDGTTIEDEIRSELDVITSDDVEYFVEKDTDFYITIKLSNPDNYEILSFTLNGKFYQSYQFEYGSDSENLILKANSGEVSGIKDFTIDTIKYIDRSEINDVIFAGDKTVKVGVTYDNLPYARTSDLNIGTNSISFNAEIADTNNLIELYNSPLKVYLYDGDNIVDSNDLNVGSNDVKFSKLKQDTLYQYALVTSYDSLDGNGNVMVVLEKHAFYTNEMLMIDEVVSNQDSVSFELEIADVDKVGDIKSIELYQEDELVQSLEDLNLREFNDLLSNNVYEIRVVYSYDLNDGSGAQTIITTQQIQTQEKSTPTVEIINQITTESEVEFEINVDDNDLVMTINKISLFKDEELIKNLPISEEISISDLTSDQFYQIVIDYSYDLNDGKGLISKTIENTFVTKPYINVLETKVINTTKLTEGDTVVIETRIENPGQVNITHAVVNGATVKVHNVSTFTNIRIEMELEDKYKGGETPFVIEELIGTKHQTERNFEIKGNNTGVAFINGDIFVKDIYITDEEGNIKELAMLGEDYYVIVEFDNPTNYEISSLTLASHSWNTSTKN